MQGFRVTRAFFTHVAAFIADAATATIDSTFATLDLGAQPRN